MLIHKLQSNPPACNNTLLKIVFLKQSVCLFYGFIPFSSKRQYRNIQNKADTSSRIITRQTSDKSALKNHSTIAIVRRNQYLEQKNRKNRSTNPVYPIGKGGFRLVTLAPETTAEFIRSAWLQRNMRPNLRLLI
jgi:hypothetical protein